MVLYLNNVNAVRQYGTYVSDVEKSQITSVCPNLEEEKSIVAVLSHPTYEGEVAAVINREEDYRSTYDWYVTSPWLSMTLYSLDKNKQELCT